MSSQAPPPTGDVSAMRALREFCALIRVARTRPVVQRLADHLAVLILSVVLLFVGRQYGRWEREDELRSQLRAAQRADEHQEDLSTLIQAFLRQGLTPPDAPAPVGE